MIYSIVQNVKWWLLFAEKRGEVRREWLRISGSIPDLATTLDDFFKFIICTFKLVNVSEQALSLGNASVKGKMVSL